MAAPTGPKCLPLRINGTLAFAVKGKGAWIAKSRLDQPLCFERLNTQEQDIKRPYRIAVSLEHSGELGQNLSQREDVKIIKLDSQAKYLAVAAGDLDAYIRESRKDGHPDVTWDHLPGAVIAQEAGCSVHQFGGGPLNFLPQSRIDYGWGVICYRGRPDGPMADLVTQLTGS